jgi:hypothetical protein
MMQKIIRKQSKGPDYRTSRPACGRRGGEGNHPLQHNTVDIASSQVTLKWRWCDANLGHNDHKDWTTWLAEHDGKWEREGPVLETS